MESFEARHSNHDLALAIAGGWGASGGLPPWEALTHLLGAETCRLQLPAGSSCVFHLHARHPTLPAHPASKSSRVVAAEVGIERPSLRLDSQAKYGEPGLPRWAAEQLPSCLCNRLQAALWGRRRQLLHAPTSCHRCMRLACCAPSGSGSPCCAAPRRGTFARRRLCVHALPRPLVPREDLGPLRRRDHPAGGGWRGRARCTSWSRCLAGPR